MTVSSPKHSIGLSGDKKGGKNVGEQQLVVFGLGKEEFGIDISRVREIVRLQNITAIPQSMDFVEGIVNLRGQIVPIVDLCKRFRVGDRSVEEAARRIIVVNMAEQNIGVLVDGVSEILRIPDEPSSPPRPSWPEESLPTSSGAWLRWITGPSSFSTSTRSSPWSEKAVLAEAVE